MHLRYAYFEKKFNSWPSQRPYLRSQSGFEAIRPQEKRASGGTYAEKPS